MLSKGFVCTVYQTFKFTHAGGVKKLGVVCLYRTAHFKHTLPLHDIHLGSNKDKDVKQTSNMC